VHTRAPSPLTRRGSRTVNLTSPSSTTSPPPQQQDGDEAPATMSKGKGRPTPSSQVQAQAHTRPLSPHVVLRRQLRGACAIRLTAPARPPTRPHVAGRVASGESAGARVRWRTTMIFYSCRLPSLPGHPSRVHVRRVQGIGGSQCGRDRPGFGCHAVSEKLRAIQYYRVL
jgi:hypothetical protein